MALETVVGQQAPQVGMIGEQDAIHIENLALRPVGRGMNGYDGIDQFVLGHAELHADALVLGHGQKMVNHVETLLAVGIVHGGDIDQRGELARRVGFEKLDKIDDMGRSHIDLQFVAGIDFGRDQSIGLLCLKNRNQIVQCVTHSHPSYRAIVPVRRIFRCNCKIP